MMFPVELIERVFALLPETRALSHWRDVVLTPDYRTLAMLARSSRQWYTLIQPRLYHRIVILNETHCSALVRCLNFNLRLGMLVRHLFLWFPRWAQISRMNAGDRLVFPALESASFMPNQCESKVIAALAMAAPHTLRRLNFTVEGEQDIPRVKAVLASRSWQKVTMHIPSWLSDKSPYGGTSSRQFGEQDADFGDPVIFTLELVLELQETRPPSALLLLHRSSFRDVRQLILLFRAASSGSGTNLSLLSGYRNQLAQAPARRQQCPFPAEIMDGRCLLGISFEFYDFIEADSLQAIREVFSDVAQGRGLASIDLGGAVVLDAKKARGLPLIVR